MTKQNFDIWGRTLELEVVYDCYPGEDISDTQNLSYRLFSEKASTLFDIAKKETEQYILRINMNEIGDDKITNIFKYVKPKAIYIKRTDTNERKVAILCTYRYNPDDGIAIVFTNEAFSEIGTENIIL